MLKHLVCSLALLWLCCAQRTLANGTPQVSWLAIHEITELYRDKQYDIVKKKLENQGFILKTEEPDYTLKGKTHQGVFEMWYETESPSTFKRSMGDKEIYYWDFSTKIEDGREVVDISFHLPDHFANYLYKEFVNFWESIGVFEDHYACNTGQECTRFYGPVRGAPTGYTDYVRLFYGLSDYSTTETDGRKTTLLAMQGNNTYTRTKQESKPPSHLPVKKPLVRRK